MYQPNQNYMPFNPFYNQQEQVSGPASPMSKPATVPSPMTLSQTQMTSPNVKFAKRETKSADRQKQKSISRMRIHPKESPQQVKLYQPPRRDSLTKNIVEKVKRIPSDAPTALIAPTDYEHIYSVKNTKARYHEDEQHRLAQIKHDHPNKK
ncbi:hypothetical protein DERP_006864 [Dermatophagoides pteronyssinus]|uniref:Uncharacterized protein n=1 Tax=Dermatophagoides pteronyssinus TaxID=6956 RepID=A0ABQ8IS81_DERPT|nr:hypothetical protein DERP_006864 [Dermatophagoides pteronyssinus]